VSVVGKCSIVRVPAMAGRQEEPECWQWPCRDDRWIKATDGRRRIISLVIIPRDPSMAQRIHLSRRRRLPVATSFELEGGLFRPLRSAVGDDDCHFYELAVISSII
jgi:hypothetical protein